MIFVYSSGLKVRPAIIGSRGYWDVNLPVDLKK
jgi:hypothetical protein